MAHAIIYFPSACCIFKNAALICLYLYTHLAYFGQTRFKVQHRETCISIRCQFKIYLIRHILRVFTDVSLMGSDSDEDPLANLSSDDDDEVRVFILHHRHSSTLIQMFISFRTCQG